MNMVLVYFILLICFAILHHSNMQINKYKKQVYPGKFKKFNERYHKKEV